ncbi:hypothetical protein SPRG_06272 [Saprolegnia parasitica CBS 223.65]|uniref:Uncharacterized protein n=1 Tax=Saprolegnia parasitica (strain CBS 223.65) TaxID=695850 RepID=A0A067CCN6_SAPPC|nr:hypothetical protein SPRG_06272 [Saprolegnia parasitica CBS 223.65]KDO28223.1 hypothetical protein SPRG_06272 [Saprolegnia parasitica CBS 223.65]|eukprot:XP_012201048.1 hypothetical protein SPRG_06272 [Saprolegnia parasitica CBS 223.65]
MKIARVVALTVSALAFSAMAQGRGYGRDDDYSHDYAEADHGYGEVDGYGAYNGDYEHDNGYGGEEETGYGAPVRGYGNENEDAGYGAPKPKRYGDREETGYGAPKPRGYDQPSGYRKTKKPAGYDGYPTSMYKNSPYRTDDKKYVEYTDGYEPRAPKANAPHPTITLEDDPPLSLPALDTFHCFLSGAPWTNCGGRSLRDYFLDQCFSMYYAMTTAADGICSGKVESKGSDAFYHGYGTAEDHDGTRGYGYGRSRSVLAEDKEGYGKPKPKPKSRYGKKPKGYKAPYTQAPPKANYCDAYQEEKCLQSQYTSITLATVQCLTENTVRILFIERYAASASVNPIEGPVLYLKKLHQFISSVIACQPDKIANYPTLWRRSGNYNPTAPYSVYGGSAYRVQLPRCTSNAATGWDTSETNGRFHCNNVEDLGLLSAPLGYFPYRRDAGDITYSLSALKKCKTSATVDTTGVEFLVKKCKFHTNLAEENNHGQDLSPLLWTNPDTLFGLLDGQNTITNRNDATLRVRTIAEIAANNGGLAKQPILEGNGVLYFCAFYACRANNGGDASSCFPSVSRDDWDLLSSNYWVPTWNDLTVEINECLASKYLTPQDVKEVSKPLLDELHQRTHICMAENEIVSFYNKINGAFDPTVQDGHIVFLRRLANEKCFLESENDCRSNQDLYSDLFNVLKTLHNRCLSVKFATQDAASEPEPYADEYDDGYSVVA